MNELPAHPPRLGRYEIRRELGRGAMAVVYEGLDPTIERGVAIKALNKDSLGDPEYAGRFLREARLAGALSHPNIVAVYDTGEEGNIAYIVMELVRGDSLKIRLESAQPVAIGTTVRIVGQLLNALSFVHGRGMVHRDVKPANVLLDPQEVVKLADFGVARIDNSSERTVVGLVLGTPRYMAPEQVMGGVVGPAADVFSVGVILYRMLTGRDPFEGATVVQVIHQIVAEDPPAPSTVAGAAVPNVFDAIVQRALAKDPARRYPTASEFARDLSRAMASADDHGEFARDLSRAMASADDHDATAGTLRRPLRRWFEKWLWTPRRDHPSTEAKEESAQQTAPQPADLSPAPDTAIAGKQSRPTEGAPAVSLPGDSTILAPRTVLAPVETISAAVSTDGTMLLHRDITPGQSPPKRLAVQLVVTASADPRTVGRVFPITSDEFVLGRGVEANLLVSDHSCSRQHAVVRYTGASFVIQDLGSSNGTVLNGRMLGRNQPQPLLFGAAIRIGDTALTFVNARDTTLPDLTGAVLAGRYRLERCLRASPKGAVYEAKISGFGGVVAMKLLSADLASYPGYGEQFQQQATLAMRLQHPNICPVLDHGLAEIIVDGRAVQTPYLCFEMMSGGSLDARMVDKTPATMPQIARWVSQVASALEHAHRNGIVHGDLKPTSVCLDADGNAYLMDFAIAGPDRTDSPLIGAPAFMAPEQWRGEPPTSQTDQFALGVLAYSLVTGSRPFAGQEEPKSRERNFRRKPFPADEEARQNGREDVPRKASEVLQRALATDPAERFESVGQFAQAFDSALLRRGGWSTAPTVFVSYQHAPSAGWAVLLARELKEKHRIATFVDTQRLDGAIQFPAKLSRAIENCQVFVCLLADSTLTSRWVREEIRLAHEFKRPMIPVFQESFTQVEQDDTLEPEIAALLNHDGVHLLDRRNVHIDHTIDDLARLVMDTACGEFRD